MSTAHEALHSHPKEPQHVFVAMPFTETPTRSASDLTSFYLNVLKGPIESEKFIVPHVVRRSEDAFNINEQVIRDLYSAHVVICDLSGATPNPNVMYELGIRLAVSSRPVILIREVSETNRPVFDISGFHTELYSTNEYGRLSNFLIAKLRRFETGAERYESPILRILADDQPLIHRLARDRAAHHVNVLGASVNGTARLFGGLVHEFVWERAKIDLGDMPLDLLKNTYIRRDELERLDWSTFTFAVGPQPAVDAYIANLYLSGVVEDDVEAAFTEAVVDYHTHFLAGDVFWRALDCQKVHHFLAETLALASLAAAAMGMIKTPYEDQRRKMRDAFFFMFNSRHIS